jgi:hypothetical protein
VIIDRCFWKLPASDERLRALGFSNVFESMLFAGLFPNLVRGFGH